MRLALTWWGWAGLVVAVVVILGIWARRAWRTAVRAELVEYLQREVPDLRVVRVHASCLELALPGAGGDTDTATFHLERFYTALAACPTQQTAEAEAARLAVFAITAQALRESAAGAALDPARDRARLRPRLLPDAAVAAMRGQPGAASLPAWPSGVAGLSVVLVLDREASVLYLTAGHLQDLGLGGDEALALAKANLAATFARDAVRQAVADRKTISVIKSSDTYDAARLLLVPEYLEAGESIAAMIPDRDTLVLIGPPEDGDWSSHQRLAKNAAGDPLWTEPLLVTPQGIARAS
jgi:hypothetical protein